MTEQNIGNIEATAASETEQQAPAAKTFTQEEVNAILARTKSQIEKKFQAKYEDLGDPEELKTIKSEWEKKQQEQQIKRGEFEKTLQEMAAKKDAEIQKRDSVIKEYKVNTPLLSAAAQYRAVNAEQVKALLANQVRINQHGYVEVIGNDGSVRYKDTGQPLGVEDLVREFLDSNPHFVSAAPATTNARSAISNQAPSKVDITKLDMKNPEHRDIYRQYRKENGIT